MLSVKRLWWCLVLGVSSLSLAQGLQPSVMPFPLEYKRTPSRFSAEDKEALQRDYIRLLRLAGAMVPDFARYDLALKELNRHDCAREDECLMLLARQAQSLYALYATVDYTLEGAVVVSGRVVRDDGKVASATETLKLPKGRDEFKDITKNALVQLFVQLKIGELSATRPVEAVKVDPVKDPIKDPPPPLPPLVIEDLGAGQRSVGRGLLFAGAGVAVVGAVLAGVGAGIGYGKALNMKNVPSGDRDTVVAAQTLTAVGFVGLGLGGVTAALGAVVWGTAAPAPITNVSVVPVAGGGGVVQFWGQF